MHSFSRRVLWAVLTMAMIASFALAATPAEADKKEFFDRGLKYYDEGKFREAEIEFRNALKEDSRYTEAHYRLALTYLKLGQLGNAQRLLFNVVTLDPKNLDAQTRLGQIALLAGQPDQALERARTVLNAEPENIDALVLLAQAYVQVSDPKQAVSTLERASELAPPPGGHKGALGPAVRPGQEIRPGPRAVRKGHGPGA